VMYLVALSLLSIVPVGGPVRESVPAVERNFFYDENGRLVFEQIIFMGHDANVQAWRLAKTAGQIPERDFEHGGYVMTWHDGETLRQVRTRSVQESFTQFDPELEARKILEKDRRRELRPPHPSRLRPQTSRES
jgi:hypothetical protein